MSAASPVFLEEDNEPFDGSIVRIEDELSQTGKLSGSIPAVTTMDDHVLATFHRLGHGLSSGQNQEEIVDPS